MWEEEGKYLKIKIKERKHHNSNNPAPLHKKRKKKSTTCFIFFPLGRSRPSLNLIGWNFLDYPKLKKGHNCDVAIMNLIYIISSFLQYIYINVQF